MSKIALSYLASRVPIASGNDFVSDIVKKIRQEKWETVNYIYVLEQGKLVGVLSLKELLGAKDNSLIKEIMKEPTVYVYPSTHQEKVAVKALQHNIKSVPVVEKETYKFLGVIPWDRILSILHEEHTEDFLRHAGIQRTLNIVDVFHSGVLRLAQLRLSWLLVGLGVGVLITIFLSLFQSVLENAIALAFFIPVIVYISGAVGTQTQTLFIRAMVLKPLSFFSYLMKEISVGFFIGFSNAILIFGFAIFWFRSIFLALTVGLAMFLSIMAAVLIGLILPGLFIKFKKDAALGTGPLATALSDLTSLVVYFLIASLIIF